MPSHLTRRQILASAAAIAAVAAMPAVAIAAVETRAPDRMAGWAFVANDVTRPLLARLPIDTYADAERSRYSDAMMKLVPLLIEATCVASRSAGPLRWVAVSFSDDNRRMAAGVETWSYRQALIDAGYPEGGM